MIGSRRAVAGLAALALGAGVLTGCGGSAGGSGAKQAITIGGYGLKTLDPGAKAAFVGKAEPIVQDIFGQLFDPPAGPGGEFVPDLATDYAYSADHRQLTITLRKGMTFTDGEPFNAEAVKFNFERYMGGVSRAAQYFTDLEKVEATGDLEVVVTFKAPNSSFMNALAYTSASDIGSPKAIQAGEDAYGLKPIGAGPFKIESHSPEHELVLVPNPDYWDAKDVHLDEIRYLDTGDDPAVGYQHVASGSIDVFQVPGTSTSPNVLDDAKANKNITVVSGEDNTYTFLPINTFKAPFDKLEARQALAHCTNRESLAKNVAGGWANPAYVVAGSDSDYYPGGSLDAAKAAYPYPFDVAKGTALVKSLGGLDFTFYNMGGQYTVLANALAQQWQACGIKASVKTLPGPAMTEAFGKGEYQAAYAPSGGLNDPYFFRTFQVADTPQGSFGFAKAHPEISGLIAKASQTSDKAQLISIWQDFFTEVNTLAVTIPILSAPNYFFQNSCLKDVDFDGAGATYKNARLTC